MLLRNGIHIGNKTVARLLRESLNTKAQDCMNRGVPSISVDPKKKELVGKFKNAGREWQPEDPPELVDIHDFSSDAIGKAIPYGVYDVADNSALVTVGTDHDTPVFAVTSIETWWKRMGSKRYPNAGEIFISADAGGSTGYRRPAPGSSFAPRSIVATTPPARRSPRANMRALKIERDAFHGDDLFTRGALRSGPESPPHPQQPGARRGNRRVVVRTRVDESRRGKRILPPCRQPFARVVPEVAQHIADRVGHLAPRDQRARMIAIRKDRTLPGCERIEPPGNADGEPLHRLRQRRAALDLDDQVQVVALDRVVHDAHAKPDARGAEGVLQHLRAALRAQIPDAGLKPQRDVHRVAPGNAAAAQMRNAWPAQPGAFMLPRPSSAFAPATPMWQVELQLLSHCTT